MKKPTESSQKNNYLILASMQDAALVCSIDNYIVEYMNQKMIDIIGHDAKGKICYKAIFGNTEPCSFCKNNQIREGVALEHQLSIPIKDRYYVITHSRVMNNDGSLSSLAIFRDNSASRALLAEKEHIADDLAALIDTANAPIFGIDARGMVNEWNQSAERITDYTKDEVMGKDLVRNFITDAYKGSVKQVLDKALAGEQTANFEFPLFTKSGERVDVLLNSTTRRDADGEIVGVVGVGQDITELNRARLEQARVADDLTALIDTANAPIFGIDAAGKVNEWNQTAQRITGYGKGEVMGKDLVRNFITDEYKGSVKQVLDKALVGEQSANFEFPLFTKTGDRVDVLLNSTTRRDAEGLIVGVVGVGQDITELYKARLEQARIADDLTALIDTANAPIFGIDARGMVNEWNQSAERITAYTKDEVMGKDLVKNFITDAYKESVKRVFDLALIGKQTANFEFPLFTKSGERVDVLLNSTTRRDAEGLIVGVIGVGQDITERKIAQKKVEASLNEKKALLREIHHRVKNNMQVIISLLRLRADTIEDPKYAALFKEGEDRIRSMALIHEQLYRSDDFSNIDFNQYVQDLGYSLFASNGVDTNRINLNIDIKDILFDLENAIPCGLIINELVSNSLKHAFTRQETGNISIVMQPINEEHVELIVSDDGKGLPDDLDVNNTESMGLELVRILSEQTLEGKMKLKRTHGTEFHFLLKIIKYKARI
ncbi:PAS domain-containing protein [Desulfococcaceae bacterium HSG7]|nr:PAS domain-containing protein [Desulfococcaceae bacterium HSG7]